ncbi:MAG TPA: hypothetical protein ENF55_04570 [Thermoprotei archaeon]|nr:hypothetical protein [Thermoprotei archaeon]
MWKIADESGIPSIVINYPSGWGMELKHGALISGEWYMPGAPPKILSDSYIYSTSPSPEEKPLAFLGEEKLDLSKLPALKYRLSVKASKIAGSKWLYRDFTEEELTVFIEFYAISISGEKYDAVLFVQNNSAHTVKVGEWSNWLTCVFETSAGSVKGMFRAKLEELSEDGKSVRIKLTEIFAAEKWAYPETLCRELVEKGILPDASLEKMVEEDKAYLNYPILLDYAKNARALLKLLAYTSSRLKWRLCFLHYHIFDSLNHGYLGYLYKGLPAYTEEKYEKALEVMELGWKIADRFVGEILEKFCDEDTLVVVVSDHGCLPSWKMISLRKILVEAGLLEYKWDDNLKRYRVVLEKTLAYPYYEPSYIWVNLKGREAGGVVEPSKYEDIRDEVLSVLKSTKDPETNTCPFELAVRREEDPYIGGKPQAETVGDILYYLKPSYQFWDGEVSILDSETMGKEEMEGPVIWRAKKIFGTHAYYTPGARLGDFTVNGIFLMKGPGVAEGLELKEPIRLTDIAPTVAHLMGLRKPKKCDGRVLYEALK